jgi:hypothetical protein
MTTIIDKRPAHSPLGASGAERWMNCPGSVVLLNHLALPESDEADYTKQGTAMHEAAAHCLNHGLDTWEVVGQTFHEVEITDDMANAVQLYLDTVRPTMDIALRSYVEFGISSPVHKDFYGTTDFGAIVTVRDDLPYGMLDVTDFKGGEGIYVSAEDNPQMKYYAFGLIDTIERSGYITEFYPDMPVRLRIVQGRWYDPADRVREWWTTVGELKAWVKGVLVPAMERAEIDEMLQAGDWCRFCPAKLACPLLYSLFGAAARHNPKEIPHLDNETLGRSYAMAASAKHYIKALEEEAFRRLNSGQVVYGTKLVNKRANRVFKSGAEEAARKQFGEKAFSAPELLSPPALEKISKDAGTFVKSWAFTPESGLTVALENDNRPGVVVRPLAELLGPAIEQVAS